MKRVLLACIVAVGFSGCFVDKMYDTTKVIYVKGKEVIITNADMLDEKTLKSLEKVDEKATRIDKTKEIITK